jgi:beta-galactosidase
VISEAAVVVDAASRWALESRSLPSPHVRHLDVARAAHAALGRSGIGCDVVAPGADLLGYRLVVVPAVYLLSDEAAASLRGYAAGGGHLVVTFCSGIADPWHRIRTGGYPGALRDVLGIRVEEFHPLHPGASVSLALADAELTGGPALTGDPALTGNAVLTGQVWSERLRAEGAEVLAVYSAGALAGLPAVTRHAFGAGTAWYLSTLLAADDLTALMGDAATAAGLLPASAAPADAGDAAPPGVSVLRRRDGRGRSWRFAFNHGTVAATLPACGLDLITGREIAGVLGLPPDGIAVIREGPSGQRK